MNKKVIYPGSFDPVTFGHIDIIKRASNLFDEVFVAVLNNQRKNYLFTIEERKRMLEESLKEFKNINIVTFNGLLVDLAKKLEVNHIVRGLRAISDFEYEFEIALTNRNISNKFIDTIFFMTDEKYFYLSSSLVKEVYFLGGNVDNMVPECVKKYLEQKREKNNKNEI
ncbi:MAG: pantetheine-phosphate adenylyltransferase [Spirochaetes bacterium]|nr:pantetheine-phosphate adenylyltransferase [Spirochaetota bacterium]